MDKGILAQGQSYISDWIPEGDKWTGDRWRSSMIHVRWRSLYDTLLPLQGELYKIGADTQGDAALCPELCASAPLQVGRWLDRVGRRKVYRWNCAAAICLTMSIITGPLSRKSESASKKSNIKEWKEAILKQATKEINRQSRRSGEADRTAVKQRRESENSE